MPQLSPGLFGRSRSEVALESRCALVGIRRKRTTKHERFDFRLCLSGFVLYLCLENIRIVLSLSGLAHLKRCCESMLIVVAVLRAMLKTSAELRLENLALRHQVAVLLPNG
jgi:hypothetical protein